jgi:hypothetical protein
MIYRSLPTLEERKKAGASFRTKLHRVNILLVIECRKRINRRKELDTDGCWTATSLDTELEVIQEYASLFQYFLEHFSRPESEFDALFALWREGKLDYGKYAALVCEYSYFRIAKQQLAFSQLMDRVVSGLIDTKDIGQLKSIYMAPQPDIKFHLLSDLEARLGLSRYFEQLYYCDV